VEEVVVKDEVKDEEAQGILMKDHEGITQMEALHLRLLLPHQARLRLRLPRMMAGVRSPSPRRTTVVAPALLHLKQYRILWHVVQTIQQRILS
jgi:hypothetical protein